MYLLTQIEFALFVSLHTDPQYLSQTSRNQTNRDAPRLFAKFQGVQPIYVLANVLGQAEYVVLSHRV